MSQTAVNTQMRFKDVWPEYNVLRDGYLIIYSFIYSIRYLQLL